MFRPRSIVNTGWLQKFISKDYLKPGNLYLIRDIPHHDHPALNMDTYFSGHSTLWMVENW